MEETIYTLDIKTNVTKSVLDVFDTMLSFQLEPVDDAPVADVNEKRIVGSVNFAGQVCGIIIIHIQDKFAKTMTAAMLGMTIEEIESDEEVRDVICEVSNIIGGNLKSFFNDSGFYCVLSTPSITSGENFDITSLNTERYESTNYRYQEYSIRIEVGVKLQSGYQADTAGNAQEPPRIDTQKIQELNLAARIPDSVINVFTTMLSMDIQVADAVSKSDLEGMRTVGAVSFAGDAMGIINIHITAQFAREMAAGMLDMAVDDVDDDQDVNDVIGELSNIVGGNLKSIFSDVGLRCELSIPSITRGSDFRIESMNMERYERFAFTFNDHTFFVEFGLKLAEGLNLPAMNGKDINYQVVEEGSAATTPQWPELAEPSETEETAPENALPPEMPPETLRETPSADGNAREDRRYEARTQPAFSPSDVNLEFLMDIPLEVTIELGRSRMKINDLLKIKEHSVVELSALADEPVDILVNHKLIAKGEVVVEGGKYGIRVIEILSRAERIKSLSRP